MQRRYGKGLRINVGNVYFSSPPRFKYRQEANFFLVVHKGHRSMRDRPVVIKRFFLVNSPYGMRIPRMTNGNCFYVLVDLFESPATIVVRGFLVWIALDYCGLNVKTTAKSILPFLRIS